MARQSLRLSGTVKAASPVSLSRSTNTALRFTSEAISLAVDSPTVPIDVWLDAGETPIASVNWVTMKERCPEGLSGKD
jgi:hypothetical protein